MKNQNRKKEQSGILSYNETPIFNYFVHIGFAVGILSALVLLILRFTQ
jgi:hypothetical protein